MAEPATCGGREATANATWKPISNSHTMKFSQLFYQLPLGKNYYYYTLLLPKHGMATCFLHSEKKKHQLLVLGETLTSLLVVHQ